MVSSLASWRWLLSSEVAQPPMSSSSSSKSINSSVWPTSARLIKSISPSSSLTLVVSALFTVVVDSATTTLLLRTESSFDLAFRVLVAARIWLVLRPAAEDEEDLDDDELSFFVGVWLWLEVGFIVVLFDELAVLSIRLDDKVSRDFVLELE